MDWEIDEGVGYDYGCAENTELFELMRGQFVTDRAAARACTTTASQFDPVHLWLVLEALARGDTQEDWAAEFAVLARNRWIPVLYEVDEVPGLGDRSFDDEYAAEDFDEDSAAGCRSRLIALLAVLDGPDVTSNYDVDGLVRDVRRVTGGNDPLDVPGKELLAIADGRRFHGR
ncbi:MAG: hypothetical protein L0H59_15515 [Tomitella sp.]|nr:hypothetical protein [Tomitella sp.]